MSHVVRAALVQATWTGDTESMIAKHEAHAREAARQGAKIIGFQEVFNAPYFCQVQEPEHYRWAEPVPDGPTVRRMQDLARETGMVIASRARGSPSIQRAPCDAEPYRPEAPR
ncbi:hypothetical protein SMICM304S_11839 [Streptomyces microflavus]